MKEIISDIVTIIGIAICLYYVPYLIRRGWGAAQNKTRKVCDICFRDINKVNEKLKDVLK
jgi:hypothetical protein